MSIDYFGHTDPEKAVIGEIDFSDIVNEKEVISSNRYKVKNIGQCKIEIYENEGQIPHFHITGISKTFNCCVRIYEPYFFIHGNKCRDTLNTNQCKELDTWLRQQNKNSIGNMSNWEAIVFMWYTFNPDCKYPEFKKTNKQPDYTRMNMFKDGI